PSAVEPVLATLAAERILRPVPARLGSDTPRYEIYHDILGEPVLAWCARHESDREIEHVRIAAARRHRRLLLIAVAAVLLAGTMAGVTIFAFTQRSEAQTQAERATRATQLAQTNAAKASAAAALAGKNARNAARQAAKAKRALKSAQKQRRAALKAKRRADHLAHVATIARNDAEQQRRIAEQNAVAATS